MMGRLVKLSTMGWWVLLRVANPRSVGEGAGSNSKCYFFGDTTTAADEKYF